MRLPISLHLLEAHGGAMRLEPLVPVGGSGRGLWGKSSIGTVRKLCGLSEFAGFGVSGDTERKVYAPPVGAKLTAMSDLDKQIAQARKHVLEGRRIIQAQRARIARGGSWSANSWRILSDHSRFSRMISIAFCGYMRSNRRS